MIKIESNLWLGKRKIPCLVSLEEPDGLDTEAIVPMALIHELADQTRRIAASKDSHALMDIKTNMIQGILLELPIDELKADEEISYERLVFVDNKNRVIHGHEVVQKAQSGNKKVYVLRLLEKISFVEQYLIQLRYSSKEGLLIPRAKSEAYRFGHDELKIPIELLRKLSVGPKGKCPTSSEITKDIRVGRIYHNNPDFKIDFHGYTLDEKPHSNLKYLVGHKDIYEQMTKSKEKEQHFIRMAVTASHSGQKRLQDSVPALLKFEDTKEVLFSNGLKQATQVLKAKYPEENKDLHPHFDIQAAKTKLDRTDTRSLLCGQYESNPKNTPVHREMVSLVISYLTLSPEIAKDLLAQAYDAVPESYTDIAAERGLTKVLVKAHQNVETHAENLKRVTRRTVQQ